MATEYQVRYSKLVDLRYRNALVAKDGVFVNNKYEGSPKAGSVKIPTRAEVSVREYNKTNGISGATSETSYVTLIIDKDYAVNEIIDGYEAAAVPDGIVADRLDSAGYGLAAQVDKDTFAELIKSGTAAASTSALTKSTVYDAIVDANEALTVANVPVNGRWLAVSPAVHSLLLKNSDFIKASDMGQEFLVKGAIGMIAGFTVYISNNMTTTEAKTSIDFIAGHPNCITRAREWNVPVKVVDLDGDANYVGATAVKGRTVYGHKVTNASGIYVKKTVTA